jgi:hypothetical protein
MREVYVISDLHIGGEPAKLNEERGFQINTHTQYLADFIELLAVQTGKPIELVINGDLVDFLAETPWAAFEYQIPNVISKLNNIIKREAHVFLRTQKFPAKPETSLGIAIGQPRYRAFITTHQNGIRKSDWGNACQFQVYF